MDPDRSATRIIRERLSSFFFSLRNGIRNLTNEELMSLEEMTVHDAIICFQKHDTSYILFIYNFKTMTQLHMCMGMIKENITIRCMRFFRNQIKMIV